MGLDKLFTSVEGRGWLVGIILVVLTLIEITPIKFNPWTWVGSLFSGKTNKKLDALTSSIEEIKSEQKSIRAELEVTDIITKRVRFLHFADEIRQYEPSRERFEQILRDIDDYEKYCKSHEDFANNVALMSIDAIKHEYKRRFLS